jgi:hypothetical protein
MGNYVGGGSNFEIDEKTVKVTKAATLMKKSTFMTGGDEMTQADIDHIRSPLSPSKNDYIKKDNTVEKVVPLEISGKMLDGTPFLAKGTSGKVDEIETLRVGDMNRRLKTGKDDFKLPVEIKDGKLAVESKKHLEELANGRSITIGSAWKLNKKTIRADYVPDKISSLEQSGDMKIAMAQAEKPDVGFKSDYATTPSVVNPSEKSTGRA